MINRSRVPISPPWVAALAAAVLVAGLGACRQHGREGAGAPAAGSQAAAPTGRVAPIEACSLLTADDASAILGGPVEKPIVSKHSLPVSGHSSRCAYLTAAQTPLKVVNLLVEQLPTQREAMLAYDQTRSISKIVSGREPEDIPNLGDKAFWEGGSVDKLHVLKGNLWLIVGCSFGPGLDQEAPARRTAAKILDHF